MSKTTSLSNDLDESPSPDLDPSVLDPVKDSKTRLEAAASQTRDVIQTIHTQSSCAQSDARQLLTPCPSIVCENKGEGGAMAISPGEHSAIFEHAIYLNNFYSPLSYNLSPAFLYPLPERHRSAPSYVPASPQRAGTSPCYLITSPQHTYTSSRYQNSHSSTPTICLSQSSSCDHQGLSSHQREPTPVTHISVTNSAEFSSQTFSFIQNSQCSLSESLKPSLKTEDSRPHTGAPSSAITSSGGYPKHSVSSSSQGDCMSSRELSTSVGDKSSPSKPVAKTRNVQPGSQGNQILDFTDENRSQGMQIGSKGSDSTRKSVPNTEQLRDSSPSQPRSTPTILRHISVLAITVPEMQAVLDLASHAEFVTILTQVPENLQ